MRPDQAAKRVRVQHPRPVPANAVCHRIQVIDHLVNECAYEHWHRMLFARFLAENHLLIHEEEGVPVSLDECEELAKQEGTDGWALAARFASRMLPQIFRPDDPMLAVELAPQRITANAIMAGVTKTPALDKIPGADKLMETALRRNPSGRLTRPEDGANHPVALSGPGTAWGLETFRT